MNQNQYVTRFRRRLLHIQFMRGLESHLDRLLAEWTDAGRMLDGCWTDVDDPSS